MQGIQTWQLVITIVAGVLGIIGTSLGIFGFTAYWNERMKHRAQKKNEQEDKVEELKHQNYLSELRKIIKEENETSVAPLKAQMDAFSHKLNIVADGTTDILRERLLSTYYKCMEKGYRTQYDYENVEHMHKEYVNLGGNTFVADCVSKIKNLPSEEEYKASRKRAGRKPKAKKQLLLENK